MQDIFSFSCTACDAFTLHHTNLALREKLYFLVDSFLLLITTATGHFAASFLQKSVSVLASGEAPQDHFCLMEERC